MFKTFLRYALRNLRRRRGYAALNISGLALGIASCLFIYLFVRHERSYDRFYPDADRIYRVALNEVTPSSDVHYPLSPYPMAAVLADDFPEVVLATRLSQRQMNAVEYEESVFEEIRMFRADSNFFEVFQLPLVHGFRQTALKDPSSIVLTASAAKKCFGDENPVGKSIRVKDGTNRSFPYTVTGVVEDIPENSHLHFDMIMSWYRAGEPRTIQQGWRGLSVYTYVLLENDFESGDLEDKFPGMYIRYAGRGFEDRYGITIEEHLAAGNAYDYYLQPLTDIHLHSNMAWEIEQNGSITTVYLFSITALFILLIACVNYVNLATARSAYRIREMGMRKVLGSSRWQLISQLLVESMLMSIFACLFALVIVDLFMPLFNNITGKELVINYVRDPKILIIMAGVALVVGMLSGSYPAIALSGFRPVAFIRAQGLPRKSKVFLRDGLVVFQFVVSISLLVGTIVVQSQMSFLLNKELGFNEENVVIIENTSLLGDRWAALKQEIKAHPSIQSLSFLESLPGSVFHERFMVPDSATMGEQYNVSFVRADHDLIQTLGIRLIQGRTFDPRRSTDSTAVVVNEALVDVMGLGQNPLGRQISAFWAPAPVIGVVKDYHFQSLHNRIEPLAYFIGDGNADYAAVRVRTDDLAGTIDYLETTWRRFVPDRAFTFSFLDSRMDNLYREDQHTKVLVGVFAILAFLVACLGLFGLSAFMAEQRTTEIGIRKVVGASVGSIVLLQQKEFIKLIVLAILIAAPVAFLLMERWLMGFAYAIELSWTFFLEAGLIAIIIALLTVGHQSVKAARANPVDALRYD